jgi:hypothetical protein
MMLLSDGSVTRHLQLLTGQQVSVVSCKASPTMTLFSNLSSSRMQGKTAVVLDLLGSIRYEDKEDDVT